MTNARFREIAPGVTVEMIATRIEFSYTPDGAGDLTATWWGQEYFPVGGSYEQLGMGGHRMLTRLSDHAARVVDAGIDPVTGSPIVLSATGAVRWLKAWYNDQYNLEAGNEIPADPAE